MLNQNGRARKTHYILIRKFMTIAIFLQSQFNLTAPKKYIGNF